MKITIIIEGENPIVPDLVLHRENHQNLDWFAELPDYRVNRCAIGAMVMLAQMMPHDQFRQFVEWGHFYWQKHIGEKNDPKPNEMN